MRILCHLVLTIIATAVQSQNITSSSRPSTPATRTPTTTTTTTTTATTTTSSWIKKSSTSPETQQEAAQDLLKRLLPKDYEKFKVTVNPELNVQNKDVFQIKSTNTSVQIIGSSGVAVSWGVLHYLKHYCHCHISWEADQLMLPYSLPVVNITRTANDAYRYYQNVCTVSYSMVWWSWERWEREIDWMALNGINLPLAFIGQEAIWKKVYLQLNLTQEELDEHFAGPAFLAWGRMGNIRGWGGPLTPSWYDRRQALQHKILGRMRSLGMTPVLPGFAGHVPKGFTRVYPQFNVTRLPCWDTFNETYSCTYFLHPTDPMFETVGRMFIEEMMTEYNGTDHIYNADPFNEETPSSNDTEYISKVGASIYKAMTSADPHAIWLMQGWMLYYNQDFWHYEQSKALLTSVPTGHMIVLDLAAEVVPQYGRLESFFGQPFIFCMLHDYGGVLGMYGMVQALLQNVAAARSYSNVTLIGTGLTPEGINQNYIMYDFMLDLSLTDPSTVNVKDWAKLYSKRRYGKDDAYLASAWDLLIRSIYNDTTGLLNFGEYIAIKRPSLAKDKPLSWYDNNDVIKAWDYFIQAIETEQRQQMMSKRNIHSTKNKIKKTTYKSKNHIFPYEKTKRKSKLYSKLHINKLNGIDFNSLNKSETFKHDLVDLTRQNLQNIATTTVVEVFDAFHKNNSALLRLYGGFLYEVYYDMDRILQTSEQFLLGKWVDAADSWGLTDDEKKHYKYNALNQISLWGPNGNIRDYAIKQWSGVVSSLIMPRWMMFITMMIDSIENNSTFIEADYQDQAFRSIEEPFTFNVDAAFPINPIGDTIPIAVEIYLKYQQIQKCMERTKIKSNNLFKKCIGRSSRYYKNAFNYYSI